MLLESLSNWLRQDQSNLRVAFQFKAAAFPKKMKASKMIPRLLLSNSHHHSHPLKLINVFISSTSTPTDPPHLIDAAVQICHAIRHHPRWESTLPHSDLLLSGDPTLLRLVISSPSLASNPLLSLRLLSFLSSHRAPIPPSTLTTCLTKCLSLLFYPSPPPNLDLSFSAFSHITSTFNFTPPLPTWNAALSACLHADRTDLVFTLYRRMNTAGDETTAGYLIRAFCKEGRLLDAYQTLREFSKVGVLPDVVCITRLVSGFARAGNYGKVSELLHLMIAGKRMPDVFTYQMIIHGLCENGMGNEGFRIFNELKLRGYGVDTVTYTSMIDGLCKMGRMVEAKRLWAEMVDKGMRPNHYTYNAVIDGCFKCGDLEEGKKLYYEMIRNGYRESTVSCNIMINGLCLQGKVNEAIVVFEEMASKGIEKDIITYNTVIQGLCKEGRTFDAVGFYNKVLEVRLEPTVSTYTPLIVALCNQGNVTDAVELVKSMKDRGLEPLVSTNDCIITAFCNAGKVEEGLSWLVKMLEKNLRPRPETFNRLVLYLCLAGRVDHVLPVLNAMFEIGCSLGRSVCYLLVDKLCGDDGSLQAEELLQEILLTDENCN